MVENMTGKAQIKAINEAVYDTRLTMVERKFYKWISTQNRHRHLFLSFRWGVGHSLKIDQKHKRR